MWRRRGSVGRGAIGLMPGRDPASVISNPSMKRLTAALFALLILCAAAFAQEIDVTRLQKLGDAISFVRNEAGITINCRDNSQVQLTVLAPDLIRVRTAFTKTIPARDHSWAIAKD